MTARQPANWGTPHSGWQALDVLPRDATDGYLERMGRRLDIVFDVDLGELAPGHHVVARGIDLGYEIPVQRWQRELEDRRHVELDAGQTAV